MDFLEKLKKAIEKNNSLLSIGLDPDLSKIPQHLQKSNDWVFEFDKTIIDATHDLVCVYKPNIAFYSALGVYGLQNLEKTIKYVHNKYTGIPVILDAKRGDIGSTAKKYAEEVFDVLQADAVTVNPYLGFDSLQPFLKRKDKGIIILCRTTNKSAEDFQDTKVSRYVHLEGGTDSPPRETIPLYIYVAEKIVKWNKTYGNCMMVTGATWPEQLKEIRNIAPDMFFLVPGIGAQGEDLQQTLKNGLRNDKSGLIISTSRAVIYASREKDFAQKARKEAQKLKDAINQFR